MSVLFEPDRPPGGKLEGLLKLPLAWTPPFFSISGELHRRFLGAASKSDPETWEILDAKERLDLQHLVSSFGGTPESLSLYVRSNALDEGLPQRGMLKSYRCDGTIEGIMSAAKKVFESAGAASEAVIGLIIQSYVAPTLWGYFSNERRVAAETRRWVCEMNAYQTASEQPLPKVRALRVERASNAPLTELLCGNRVDLFRRLRSVGRYFYERKLRRHLEWVWDRERLLIVQNDEAPDPVGSSPECAPLQLSRPIDDRQLRVFRPFTAADAKVWQKLKCVQTFKEANLPTAPLFVLRGAKSITRLSKKQAVNGLSRDLRILTSGPLVIRTDVRRTTTLYAPRTDGVSSPKDALAFLRHSAQGLIEAGIPASEICFIAHRFIPALASAFSLASPSSRRVRIDSLWGLPDGLEFCSHDSFEVDSRIGSVVARKVRYKPSFLGALPNGQWKVIELGPAWDWKPSLPDETLRRIAEASSTLGRLLRKNVVIMWFADVAKDSGHPDLLPWRFTTEDAPRQVDSAVGVHFKAQPYYVRNPEDLDRLETLSSPISSVVLRPDGPHLRDETFLTRLGQVAKGKDMRIDLEGSPLSHAYYVLKRTAAHVACVDPINPKAVRHKFEKLVRDRIPVQIRGQGERVQTVNLSEPELLDVLKAKIVEEALEVLWTTSPESLREEMADVMEVLRALCTATRGSLANLQKLAAKKRRRVGGFGKGIVLVETEEAPLIEVKVHPGLFGPRGSKSSTGIAKSVVAAGRRPKTQHDRIIVPLIPSAPSQLRGPARIYFRQLGLSFKVLYKEKTIEIVLERETHPVDANQLSLPFATAK